MPLLLVLLSRRDRKGLVNWPVDRWGSEDLHWSHRQSKEPLGVFSTKQAHIHTKPPEHFYIPDRREHHLPHSKQQQRDVWTSGEEIHIITHSWQIRMGNCVAEPSLFLLCCSLYCWLIKCSSPAGYFNNVLKCEEWTYYTVGSVFEDHSRSSLRYSLQKRSCVEKPQVCISAAPPRVPFSGNLLSSAISFPAKPERVELLFCLFR